MDNPSVWAGIYLAIAAAFGIGEIAMAGTFFLLPFAIGALVASIVSLVGAPVIVSFPVFLVTSFMVFLGFRPLARRLDASTPEVAGIGANRLVGVTGTVTEMIPATPGEAGMVRVDAEIWKADSSPGTSLEVGTNVRVLEVRGTRLVVEPAHA
jgi:membrane protein implicated in regulation of membrane protease activity